ncbi:MAG TPA: hypothetical protein DD435_11865 [Cyanobacteria bacterium UBA8530]|nr:hypothetical protein [Cyanobacteria bacterium UBA8530]
MVDSILFARDHHQQGAHEGIVEFLPQGAVDGLGLAAGNFPGTVHQGIGKVAGPDAPENQQNQPNPQDKVAVFEDRFSQIP